MRKNIIAANWKMNGSTLKNNLLLEKIINDLDGVTADVIIFPPFVYLAQVVSLTNKTDKIRVGAQNIAATKSGAFTGEISANMVSDIGCRYVILGHSERRNLYYENNATISSKIQMAHDCNLKVILCIGEQLTERKNGLTNQILAEQLTSVIDKLGIEIFADIVLAYEPVWAIGTGIVATPKQAQEAHKFIRNLLTQYDKNIAQNITILYGGSMNKENCGKLLVCDDIDGGLVGGASLNAHDFLTICKAA